MLHIHMRNVEVAAALLVLWTAMIGGVTAVRRSATKTGKARH